MFVVISLVATGIWYDWKHVLIIICVCPPLQVLVLILHCSSFSTSGVQQIVCLLLLDYFVFLNLQVKYK